MTLTIVCHSFFLFQSMPNHFLPKNCEPTKKQYLVKCIRSKDGDREKADMDSYYETNGDYEVIMSRGNDFDEMDSYFETDLAS